MKINKKIFFIIIITVILLKWYI